MSCWTEMRASLCLRESIWDILPAWQKKHDFDQPEMKLLHHVSNHTEHCVVSPLSVKWIYSSSRRERKCWGQQNIPPQANIHTSSRLQKLESVYFKCVCVCVCFSEVLGCRAVDVYKWVAPEPSDSNSSALAGTLQTKIASEQEGVCVPVCIFFVFS